MLRRLTCVLATAALSFALLPAVSTAQLPAERYQPGAPGAGDAYFPLDGNGGYDVKHYDIRVAYHPATDRLRGVVRIKARATQSLSAFNLDFDGMKVKGVRVNGKAATWRRHRGELTVQPSHGIRKGRIFRTQVRYVGVPKRLGAAGAGGGFFHGKNRALALGQPHSASTWFPVNDHPVDKATYSIHVTVPRGLKAVSNGRLRGHSVHGSRVTWNWKMATPMASYLATIAIGKFNLRRYRQDGLQFLDAVDKKLLAPYAPRSGEQFAISRRGQPAYKRLSHQIDVPARGAIIDFWVNRDTEESFDYVFAEAHTVGRNDWTTLPDANGHTTRSTGFACPYWLQFHPFLRHYQTPEQGSCRPTGTTGKWWAATGLSLGWEKWSIDLSRFAGGKVQFSISYVSDDIVKAPGVMVDDIVVPTGQGTTSFEKDGNIRDGWTVTGPPTGSEQNPNDWIIGSTTQAPPSRGKIAQLSLARQPRVIRFLAKRFGPYPFDVAGGIVPLERRIQFALETQTRPVYGHVFFDEQDPGTDVIVHELAHQWYGDALTVRRWRHIWLNEGFATYAEWLWDERTGDGTAQQIFNSYKGIPAGDPFWDVRIGNPGPDQLLDFAIYARGAMTLHKLRMNIGDEKFFQLLRTWTRTHKGDHVTTAEFVRLAERISGKHLKKFFQKWLMTTRKPIAATSKAAPSPSISPLLQKDARLLLPRMERVASRR